MRIDHLLSFVLHKNVPNGSGLPNFFGKSFLFLTKSPTKRVDLFAVFTSTKSRLVGASEMLAMSVEEGLFRIFLSCSCF